MKNFLAILLVAIPLAAQISPVPVTLTQARQLALAHNPQIAAARHDLAAAEARIKIARSSLYPRVTFSGIAKAGLSGATNSLGLIGLPNSPFYRNFAASLNLSQTIFDFGQRAALIDAAERRRQAAAADLSNTQAAVCFEVERAYWKLLRAQLLTTGSDELLKARRGAVRKAEVFYAVQYRSGLAVDEARSALALAQVEAQQRSLDTQESNTELSVALGQSGKTTYLIAQPPLEKLLVDDVDALIQSAYLHRPDLTALHARRQAAEAYLRFTHNLRRPSLSLALAGGYARFSTLLLRELTAAGLGLTVPLFTGKDIDGQIEEAAAQLASLSSQEDALREKILLQVNTAALHYRAAVAAMAHLDSEELLRQADYRLASQSLRQGIVSSVDLDRAQATLTEAKIQRQAAEFMIQLAVADVHFTTGQM